VKEGPAPAAGADGAVLKVTTVRQTPLTAIESPSWQSLRRVDDGGSEMVREVPPVSSWGLRAATTKGEEGKRVSR
jgi:hypothetical protein